MDSSLSRDKADLVRRLCCVEDCLQGITALVERGADCQSVLLQIVAVQAALHQVTNLLVKHHLCACLEECLQNPDVIIREHCLAEIISLYQLRGGSWPPVVERNSYDC